MAFVMMILIWTRYRADAMAKANRLTSMRQPPFAVSKTDLGVKVRTLLRPQRLAS
jgi:hypothetical protein